MRWLFPVLLLLLLLPALAKAQDMSHLRAMAAEKHPWMAAVLEQQNKAGYPLLAWKATGEAAHRQAAIDQLLNPAFVPPKANRAVVSNYGLFYQWLFRELKSEMTATQRADFERRMANWRAVALAQQDLGDSDEMLGNRYFLLEDSPEWLIDRCKLMCETAATGGGEWFTGTGYEAHDLQLVLMGAFVDGLDKHPEVIALAKAASEQLLWKCTAGREDMVQWGDLQAPNMFNIRRHNWVPVVALLYAVGKDPRMLDLLAELTAGEKPTNIGELTYILPFLDPRTIPAEPTNHNPQGLRTSTATGLSIFRRGDWLVQHHATVSPPLWVEAWGEANWPLEFKQGTKGAFYLHHAAPGGAGDVRIWNGKEWVLGHPLAYGTPPDWSNIGLFAGYSVTHLRGLESVEATDNGFKATGWIDGRYMRGPGRGNPKPFMRRYERMVEYQHSDSQKPGVLHVRDVFDNLKRPERSDGWNAKEWAAIAAVPALNQQVWHCQTQPEKTARGYRWKSFGGQTVTLVTDAKDSLVDVRPGKQKDWGRWFGDTWLIRLLDDRVRDTSGGPIVIATTLYVGETTNHEPAERAREDREPSPPSPVVR